jgi:hypothetical protein
MTWVAPQRGQEGLSAEGLRAIFHLLPQLYHKTLLNGVTTRSLIPNYKARRKERRFNGSGHGEKANDLLVARRQKHKGMHWSWATSDALTALKTLMLNHGWDLYWQKRQALPLAAT